MTIQFHDDSQWPGRIRITIRGAQDIWVTHAEATIMRDQLDYILKNPIPETKPIKMFRLYDKRGSQ